MTSRTARGADQVDIACPKCGSRLSQVIETRAHRGNKLRRRLCRGGHYYATVETAMDCDIPAAMAFLDRLAR